MFDKLTDTCLISSRFFSYSWSPASAAMIAPKFPYQGRLRFLGESPLLVLLRVLL